MNVHTANTVNICPLCDQVVGEGVPVQWDIVLGGQAAKFQMLCCSVDATLCGIFPTLKHTLWIHPATIETLGRLIREAGA